MLKSGGPVLTKALHDLFVKVWETGTVPRDWRTGVILPLYKGKGSTSDCGNHRGITLLSVPGKAFAHILLNRIKPLLLEKRRPQQSGFTPGRSTVDRILALNLASQTRREFQQPLYVTYVDLKAAFDSVYRPALWQLLKVLGVPEKVISLVSALYSDTTSRVRVERLVATELWLLSWFAALCFSCVVGRASRLCAGPRSIQYRNGLGSGARCR